jgi:hypothetical protein
MRTQTTLTLATALALTAALLTSCSKSEPAASTASQPPAAIASATTALDFMPSFPEAQPTPGAPVATFTPSSDTPPPMLPTLGATPTAPDEHGHSAAKDAVRRIAPEEAAMLVQSGDAILVDVRSKDAFVAGHIKGSVNIPYQDLSARARTELPLTRWIIPYCT